MRSVFLGTILLISLIGAGATGAYVMTGNLGHMGGFHMAGGHMGGNDYAADECSGYDGDHPEDCPYEDLEECQEHQTECEEHYQGCDEGSRDMGC